MNNIMPESMIPEPSTSLPSKSTLFQEIKNIIIKILIGCLIAAAALAVVTVLIGGLSDIMGKALMTLALVAIHAIAALGYISTNDVKNEEELSFFTNTFFVIIVLSFFTSVFGTWQIINGDLIIRMYGTYFILAFAALHGNMLHEATGKTTTIDRIVIVNYAVMVLVIAMILPIIFYGAETFESYYFRGLAALGIIDATLSILAVSLHRLYLNKHPQAPSMLFTQVPGSAAKQPANRRISPLIIIVGIYIIGQILASVFSGFYGHF
jgi:hypothetical protein